MISCGIVVTNGSLVLGVIPWGKPKVLDLPKGQISSRETPIEAACREFFEETGLLVSREQLISLGKFNYLPEKDLHLFLLRTRRLPSIDTMSCGSFFTNPFGKVVPEVIGYRYAKFDDLSWYRGLQPILRDIQKIFV